MSKPQPDALDFSWAYGESAFKPPNLRQKLAIIMGEIGYIQKRGKNERQNYSYVQAADIAGIVSRLFAEHGVAFVANEEAITWVEPRKTSGGSFMYVCHAHMRYTIMDGDSGEVLEIRSTGEGQDTGDKAIYKAKTGALKYALQQTLLIATGDDPENDDERPPKNSFIGNAADVFARNAKTNGGPVKAQTITPEDVAWIREQCLELRIPVSVVAEAYHKDTIEELTREDLDRAKARFVERRLNTKKSEVTT